MIAVVSLYTTAVCGDPVSVNPLGLVIATDTVSPLPTVMLEIASVLVVPLPLKAPLVAPVTVMSPAARVVGSTLKVSVNPVESAVPDVPPVWTALSKVTDVGGTVVSLYTTAVCGDPLMVNPLGHVIATDTVSPLPTVMSEIARLLVVPLPLKSPLVAPVTVMLSAVKVVGSTLKVRVNIVVVVVPSAPFAATALSKVTAISSTARTVTVIIFVVVAVPLVIVAVSSTSASEPEGRVTVVLPSS